jgi:hypothetical protein
LCDEPIKDSYHKKGGPSIFLRKNTKLWGHQWNNFPHWRYVAKWGPQIKPCWQDNHFRAGIVNVAPRSTPILRLSVPTSYAHPTTNMEPVFLKNIPILRCTRSGHHLLNHLVKSWQWEKYQCQRNLTILLLV